MPVMTRPGERTVARQILAWQLVVVFSLVVGGVALAWLNARQVSGDAARDRVGAIAVSVANSPTVRAALSTRDPSTILQPYAEAIRRDSGTDFVVVMNTKGIRYTHPNTDNIGKKFVGHITAAVAGKPIIEEYAGTLGPSVRTVEPVRDGDRVVGLVSVGITTERVQHQVVAALPPILIAAALVGAIGALGASLISRRLKKQTHGLGENEITRMYEYYDAVLRAVREGLLLLDQQGRITLMNDEAKRLLGVDDQAIGKDFASLGLSPGLAVALASGKPLTDDIHLVADRVLVVNHASANWQGRGVGSVVTLRDRTDLQAVTAELDTVRGLADTLRSQNHESSNRLHTMVSLIEIGRPEAAVEFATQELALAQQFTDRMVQSVDEPVIAALLLGKMAQAAERGVKLTFEPDSSVTGIPLTPADAVTILGNLIDNALDAAQGAPERHVSVWIDSADSFFHARIEDSGAGISPADRDQVFVRGWSTKPQEGGIGRGLGLALAGQAVRRYLGEITVTSSGMGGARFAIRIGQSRIEQADS
ncbi:MAG: sensor histidine kinase [Kineosporiaceae bacterium]|nr:sensor histidine kinase [Aeromicrobium sp.]